MDYRDQAVKMEDPIRSSSFFDSFTSSNPSTSFLDYTVFDGGDEKGSMGFMELLGAYDFGFSTGSSSVFQEPVPLPPLGARGQTCLPPPKAVETNNNTAVAAPELSESPPTPNSSSISSESMISSTPTDDLSKPTDDEQLQHKTNKHLKSKKKSQKRQKEPRFAFMTKSEVDHLEDGYRWRKYGQKAVKNSPFPRSYYRCTSASCNVKKRVERSFNDPSIVVTTYEGQHIHPSPMIHRQSPVGVVVSQPQPQFSGFFTIPTTVQMTLPQRLQFNNMTPLNCGFNLTGALERRFSTPPSALLRDDGLLQDIVPSTMRKQE